MQDMKKTSAIHAAHGPLRSGGINAFACCVSRLHVLLIFACRGLVARRAYADRLSRLQATNPVAKEHVDILLKLNPDYANWIAGAPQGTEKLYAFVHAATWADDIKAKDDYYEDQVKDSTAKQILPYGHLKHAYWHFKDAMYTPDGTSLPQPDPVDAVYAAQGSTR
ncbi:hypothetical protein N2605_25075 [Bradyrhizobium yuanmingense]|uniref:hypothetical protein n=1 Tax=Bradyrhizobium yuanmingense TaxID=108015 RepID=UPI0021A5D1CF|nr:hypothetical protein [Bradyrhizobium sp. CB1024]UWU82848.1 hypothetical protein N2605_25075 [Bradyrhizobium sp. CB1024]